MGTFRKLVHEHTAMRVLIILCVIAITMAKPQVGYIAGGNPPARDNVGAIGTQNNNHHPGSGTRNVAGNNYDIKEIKGGANLGTVSGGSNNFGSGRVDGGGGG